ncbi:MAG: hypothetical protein QXP49_05160, partial [Nitrososphaerota archaeon]
MPCLASIELLRSDLKRLSTPHKYTARVSAMAGLRRFIIALRLKGLEATQQLHEGYVGEARRL